MRWPGGRCRATGTWKADISGSATRRPRPRRTADRRRVSALDILGIAVRWTLFAALLVMTGVAAFRFVVLHKLAAGDDADRALCADVARRAASLGMRASVAALLA